MFYYLLIVNKNGSLIYDKSFFNIKLGSNVVINMASTFYSQHAISAKLTPPGHEKTTELKLENSGIEVLEAGQMKLFCYQTLTKIKFIFVTSPETQISECENNYRKIYDLYSDVVAKNPNYELDMPIRVKAFDEKVIEIFGKR